MLRFSCIILFLFNDVTKGTDIEVEARVRMDPQFMKRMEKTLRMEQAILRSANSLSDDIPDIEKEKENEKNKDEEKDEHILEHILEPQFSRNNHNDRTVKEIHEDRLEKKGLEGIESVAEYLRLKYNFTLDEALVKESCEQYSAKLRSYLNFMSKKNVSDDAEQENIILDKVDMAISLQSSLERTLLKEVIATYSNISKADQYVMTEAVLFFSMRNKQTEMKYVCKTMGICRPFPGFTDHLAKILSEILKLYDVKFQYFVIKSAKLLISKRSFLETVLRDEIIQYLKEKAKNIVDANIDDMRERVSVLRSVITQRHRVVNVVDKATKARTKATRIILDIIDTVFDKVGIDEVEKRAETVINGIQDWAADLEIDIEPTLNTFITDSVATMKYEMNSDAVQEIKTLSDIIYFGQALGNQSRAEYLMTKGSKFVNGNEFVKSDIGDFHLKLNEKVKQLLK